MLKALLERLGLIKRCPWNVQHYRWATFCACGLGTETETHHGGLYSFEFKTEMHMCPACHPASAITNVVHVDNDEFALLVAFRLFVLKNGTKPYRIAVTTEDEVLPLLNYQLPGRDTMITVVKRSNLS